jgi:hypothetical protein
VAENAGALDERRMQDRTSSTGRPVKSHQNQVCRAAEVVAAESRPKQGTLKEGADTIATQSQMLNDTA